MERVAIRALPEDTVGRIAGVAQPLTDTLAAPLSGRPCMYWVVEVVEMLAIDGPKRLLVDEQRGAPFVLVEDGHRAIVDPAHAVISLVFDHERRARTARLDARQQAILDTYLASRAWSQTELLVFREAAITVDARIAIVGAGSREPDPEARTLSYRDGGQTRLRLASSRSHPLSITDDPRFL